MTAVFHVAIRSVWGIMIASMRIYGNNNNDDDDDDYDGGLLFGQLTSAIQCVKAYSIEQAETSGESTFF